MPPKKKKSLEEAKASITSESTLEFNKKPKKKKPLTRKEKEKLRRMEREMKEALEQLRKNADAALAEFKALEEAAEKKAKAELFEHNRRVELLTKTCENFKLAKSRLLHENNQLREAEIWERYITTDRKPYPEDVPNMRDHLYLWRKQKESEYMEFALTKCDSYVDTLMKLDELIEYPLYSTKDTVENRKELRREWRSEFMYKIDKACFNMIKNLAKNFDQDPDHSHIFTFDDGKEHVQIGICAYVENKTQGYKPTPKIPFGAANVEIVMPAAYRTTPFVVRLVHLDQDFLSDSSMTYYCPESLRMEPDLLKEIRRCFDAKKEAKLMVADREREKVRQAKQKVLEAQAAASMAEKSFNTFQKETLDPTVKWNDGVSSPDKEGDVKALKKKEVRMDYVVPFTTSTTSLTGGASRRPRLAIEDDEKSFAKSLMQSTPNLKTLDTISMKSGMRRKQERARKLVQSSSEQLVEMTNMFWIPSMVSFTEPTNQVKVSIRRSSSQCFEQPDEEDEEAENGAVAANADDDEEVVSYDSLDLMFGTDDEDDSDDDEQQKIKPVRELVKNTVIVDRDANKQQRIKSIASVSGDGKKGRKRKSAATVGPKGRDGSDDAQQTASEIFDNAEETRQDLYISSLYFSSIPQRRYHINLREYGIIGGTYILDLIFHESQPHTLRNGNSVQIFYGEMNIKLDEYKYDYHPPSPPGPDEDPDDMLDSGLQHLLHVKVPLPTTVFFPEPPIVALWDRRLKYWSTENVYKQEVDPRSGTFSFSAGRVQPFALFTNKHCLLPFETWTMKPKLDSEGVLVALFGSRVTLEFHIVGFQVCLVRAKTTDGLVISQVQDILGELMHLHKLIDVMKSRGLNVFPDEDGFLYCKANSKDVVLEDHAYLSLAMFADTLEFLSCETNTDFKRRKLAFRVREYLSYDLELRFRTVTATNLTAQIYRVGLEDSFDESKLEASYGFCPDVYYLLAKAFAHVSPPSPPNPLQILAVYALLSRLKVFSYCGVLKLDSLRTDSESSKRSIRRRGKKKPKPSGKNLLHSSSEQLLMS